MKNMKINRTIARAIAGKVIDNVSKVSSEKENKVRKLVESSPEAAKLKKLSKEISVLEAQVNKEEEKLRNRFPDVHINWSVDYLRVSFSGGRKLRAESVANDVILANQLDGIDIPKLVEHVSKKYMA